MIDLLTNGNGAVFYFILLATTVVMLLPFVGKCIRIVETMVHELGHLFVGRLVGAKINQINLLSNAGGETHIQGVGKFKQFLIALAGYPFSILAAWLGFYLFVSQGYILWVVMLCLAALFCLIFYIRNPFGVCWTTVLLTGNGLLLYFNQYQAIQLLTLFYSCIIFLSSISSSLTLLGYAFHNPQKAGDAAIIAKVTGIPTIVAALIFVITNTIVAWRIVVNYFPTLSKEDFINIINYFQNEDIIFR